jgi:hypothetical protein
MMFVSYDTELTSEPASVAPSRFVVKQMQAKPERMRIDSNNVLLYFLWLLMFMMTYVITSLAATALRQMQNLAKYL